MFFQKHQSTSEILPEKMAKAASYINATWELLERYSPHDEGTFIGLPHPYIVPSISDKDFSFDEMYYWDSYFISLGLLGTPKQKIADNMLENLCAMFARFKIIPNASRFFSTSRSQPPLLTSFIFLVYEADHKSKEWLDEHMTIAKEEYRDVWMGERHPHWRNVHKGLSRFYEIDVLHDLAEAESGWDMNPRFYRNCLSFLPIDLNLMLYKYEQDFAKAAAMCGHIDEAKHWQNEASVRQKTINELMWDEEQGFYFDYNFEKRERGDIWSLAPYFALWTGCATEQQASRLVANLSHFEYPGGLVTCAHNQAEKIKRHVLPPMQWDYPNGWAPLQWITIEGLKRYGYVHEAERLATKWLKCNLDYFTRKGTFIEKYNVVHTHEAPVDGVYPTQTGFGWTNAIFYRLGVDYGYITNEEETTPPESPKEVQAEFEESIPFEHLEVN